MQRPDLSTRVLVEKLDDRGNRGDFAGELCAAVKRHRPEKLVMVEPSEWRVKELFAKTAFELGIELEMRPDRHFVCSHEDFEQHARGRKQLRLEYFYRELRRKQDVLMQNGKPVGGKWNFDKENRGRFGKAGPDDLPPPKRFRQDATTTGVLKLVEKRYTDHPGKLDHFDWPVTESQAKQALDDFIQNRLARFGEFQDAMWSDEPYLYHSRISAAMNLKLLDPRGAIHSAEAAYHAGIAPLNAVEGFIRQVLGWREYVRGIYWLHMPGYLERNAMNATAPLPDFYWTGDTEMNCLRQAIGQTLDYGYAHHIQRLMVTGLFPCYLASIPRRFTNGI